MWWFIGAFMGWATRQAVTQHNQAKIMSQVPDWQGDKPQSLPTRDRALLYAGGASFLSIALLVSLVSVSSALVFLAVGAFAVWSYRRSSRKKYGSATRARTDRCRRPGRSRPQPAGRQPPGGCPLRSPSFPGTASSAPRMKGRRQYDLRQQ